MNFIMKATTIFLVGAGIANGAQAANDMTNMDHSKMDQSAMQSQTVAADATTAGEIKKVDKDSGKLTIKHGELKNLGMPSMTMVFQVKDKAILDQVKAGDKVNFVAEKLNGAFTVTQLDMQK